MQFSWPPFVMGSAFLVILLIMKKLVSLYFYIWSNFFCCKIYLGLSVLWPLKFLQGKTNKKLRFLRASGPLTAVVLGTLFVKIFRPPAISVVSKLHLLFCPELYDVMQYSKIVLKPVPWFAFFHLTFVWWLICVLWGFGELLCACVYH